MKKEVFLSIKEEAAEDLKIPDALAEMMERSLYLPSLIQKWNEYFQKQTLVVKSLEIKKAELYAKLEEEWKFHKPVAWSGRELNDQVCGDERYVKLNRELAEQEFYQDYIKGIYDNMKGIPFTIKSYLAYKELIKL